MTKFQMIKNLKVELKLIIKRIQLEDFDNLISMLKDNQENNGTIFYVMQNHVITDAFIFLKGIDDIKTEAEVKKLLQIKSLNVVVLFASNNFMKNI